MKTLLFILCLFFTTLINAQIVNYKDFYNERMDEVMFDTLKQYGDYIHDIYLYDRSTLYEIIKRNHKKLSIDKLSAKINARLSRISNGSIVGIMDSIQCKNLKTYQEIAGKCNSDWNNPSDAFFRSMWGNKIMPVCYYNKKTGICYIFVCYE